MSLEHSDHTLIQGGLLTSFSNFQKPPYIGGGYLRCEGVIKRPLVQAFRSRAAQTDTFTYRGCFHIQSR